MFYKGQVETANRMASLSEQFSLAKARSAVAKAVQGRRREIGHYRQIMASRPFLYLRQNTISAPG